MSNERIDVLAVMDEMIDCYGSVEECPDDTEFLEGARRARAAVAELIEAAKAIKANPHIHLGDLVYQVRELECEGWDGPAVKQWSDAVAAFDAALARVSGGAA